MNQATQPLQHSMEQAAELLGMHRNTVHRLIVKGELKSHLIGSRRFVPHSELVALIERAQAGQQAA